MCVLSAVVVFGVTSGVRSGFTSFSRFGYSERSSSNSSLALERRRPEVCFTTFLCDVRRRRRVFVLSFVCLGFAYTHTLAFAAAGANPLRFRRSPVCVCMHVCFGFVCLAWLPLLIPKPTKEVVPLLSASKVPRETHTFPNSARCPPSLAMHS